MRLVDMVDGALEVRWTWLPYWMAINPVVVREVEEEIFDTVKLNGTTNSDADLDLLHARACEVLAKKYSAFSGLSDYLKGLTQVVVDGS